MKMLYISLFASLVLSFTSMTQAKELAHPVETRCGWFENPTPANIWLTDRDGEWTIGIQGGYQVAGEWDWPKFKKSEWVVTNSGGRGYGCACFKVTANAETKEILHIYSTQSRPLKACRKDPALKEPN